MPKITKPVNTLMDEHLFGVLGSLACKLNCSRGAVIRQGIRHMESMILNHEPTCANGQRCFTPHMHTPPAAKPPVT